eukprot:Lankesteria_metandrocarpae@DN4906_c0_g1_i1.p1
MSSVGLPSGFRRKLVVLGTPDVESFDINDKLNFYALLLYLEKTHLRVSPPTQRSKLQVNENEEAWRDEFAKYCTKLGVRDCAYLDINRVENRLEILNRIASLAVQDLYLDKTEADTSMKAQETDVAAAEQLAGPLTVLHQHVLTTNQLLQKFMLPKLAKLPAEKMDEDKLVNDLSSVCAALKCVRKRVSEPDAATMAAVPTVTLDLPLGFIPPAELKVPLAILRLLHCHELRSLQNHVNNTITDLQKITADPKTDARLGKVGR